MRQVLYVVKGRTCRVSQHNFYGNPDSRIFSSFYWIYNFICKWIFSFQVSQGCKGSLNIAACEIVVSPTDHTRLDLIISAGEQVSRRHYSRGVGLRVDPHLKKILLVSPHIKLIFTKITEKKIADFSKFSGQPSRFLQICLKLFYSPPWNFD
jgi:hypothetical protein